MGPNNFQSSFIPKFDDGFDASDRKKTSVLGLFVSVVFVGVILVVLGLLVYSKILQSSISESKQQLALAESGLDITNMERMVLFSKKLALSKDLINKHKVISNFLSLLSKNTVQTVQFNDLTYDMSADGLKILLSGLSLDYGSLALQQTIFAGLKDTKSLNIGDLYIDEKGRVVFKMEIILDPASAIYLKDANLPKQNDKRDINKSDGQEIKEEELDASAIKDLDVIDDFNL